MARRVIEFNPPIWGTDYNNEPVEVIAMGYWPEIDTGKWNDLGYSPEDYAHDKAEADIYKKHLMVSVRLDGSGLERASSCLYVLGDSGVTLNQDELEKELTTENIISTG